MMSSKPGVVVAPRLWSRCTGTARLGRTGRSVKEVLELEKLHTV